MAKVFLHSLTALLSLYMIKMHTHTNSFMVGKQFKVLAQWKNRHYVETLSLNLALTPLMSSMILALLEVLCSIMEQGSYFSFKLDFQYQISHRIIFRSSLTAESPLQFFSGKTQVISEPNYFGNPMNQPLLSLVGKESFPDH